MDHTFLCNAFGKEQTANQKHQRHKKYVIEILKNIKTYPPFDIYNRVSRIDVGVPVKARKSGVCQTGMMSHHQNCEKRSQIIYPNVPVVFHFFTLFSLTIFITMSNKYLMKE